MDPSRSDSRYNLNYSMSSIGLSLADQTDMYGNPAAVAALGGRPPSAGILQSMGVGVGGASVGSLSRSSNLISGGSQCQSLSNNSSAHGTGQLRGIKRTSSGCYEEPHHRISNTSGSSLTNMQSIDNCAGNPNLSHNSQQQHAVSVSAADNVDDTYNVLQSKKSPPANGKKTKGRVKIKMEYIDNKLRRYTTFSKRKTGIMKKAYELSTLTGTQVMLLVASETGHVYTFATRKLQPMITSEAGKQLIQTCLNSPDPPSVGGGDQRMSATGFEETELSYNIADEDSKEIRYPASSGNDSEDSSDIDGVDITSHDTSLNKKISLGEMDKTVSNGIGNCQQECVNYKSSASEEANIFKILEPPSDLSSAHPHVTHDVLLQLIKAGHLQVHTEEDGSGHQYVAIPLSPSTVKRIHSNKTTSKVLLDSNSEETQIGTCKNVDIKEEV